MKEHTPMSIRLAIFLLVLLPLLIAGGMVLLEWWLSGDPVQHSESTHRIYER